MSVIGAVPAGGGKWTGVKVWAKRIVRAERPAARRIKRYERRHMIASGVAFVALLVALLVFLDAIAVTTARQLPAPVIRFFNFVTDFGKSGWVLWPLGIFLAGAALWSAKASGRTRLMLGHLSVRALYLFSAIALPGLFVNLIKGVLGRARPFVGGAADPYLFKIWTWVPAYASFPSGHSTAAASIAFAFGAIWPKWRIPLWIYAAFILVSRVVLTAHHPSDVVGGLFFGAAGAWLIRHYFAARGLGFAVDGSGRIYAAAGPSWPRLKRVAAPAFAQ